MDINYVLTAHGLIGGGSDKPSAIEDVKDLIASSSTDGKRIDLTWKNPLLNEFIMVEVYVSNSDLTGQSYKNCQTNHTLAYSGTGTSYSHTAIVGSTYYFKVFAKYNSFGENLVSRGVSISAQAKDTEPPAPITNFKVDKEDNGSVSLSWTNPVDADYNKIKILTKQGSYPANSTDGTLVYEGAGTSAIASGLTNDVKYYFRAFTYDNSGNEQNGVVGMQITGTPSDVKIYGVRIDTTNSNPETAVSYTDNAVGMTPAPAGGGSSSWDNVYPFNEIRPVLFKDGVVVSELDKSDFSKTKLNVVADITSGSAGDVMIEFPKIWWKFERIGNNLDVRYATKQVDPSWKAWGHTRETTVKDYCYIGAYLGYVFENKLRSLSEKPITVNRSIGQFRTVAQANGVGYDQMGYYQLLMLQVLFIIKHKSRDSQTALGRGFVDGNSASSPTGVTKDKGMNFGEVTGKQQVKFCGIEDFWGNVLYFIDGIICSTSRNILIGTQNFSDTGSGYINYGQGATTDIGGYTSDVQGTSETGFIVSVPNGSSTTHYTDNGFLYGSALPLFGGSWAQGSAVGAFRLNLTENAGTKNASIGARTMYL